MARTIYSMLAVLALTACASLQEAHQPYSYDAASKELGKASAKQGTAEQPDVVSKALMPSAHRWKCRKWMAVPSNRASIWQ